VLLVDAEARSSRDVAVPFEWIAVPKPDGTSLRAPLIPLTWLGALHAAVAPLVDAVDASASPGVCGYRRGAEVGSAYSIEYRRFTEFSVAEASNARYVVSADVRRFFRATSWRSVLSSAQKAASTAAAADLALLSGQLEALGLTHLPPGYADARFLANMVLLGPDEAIGVPFTRWVDDYRIFAATLDEAHAALRRLTDGLSATGLMINEAKVRIESSEDFLAGRGAPLTSVYHPEMEPAECVQAALRAQFFAAAVDPVSQRRLLRFVLPRLAAERNDIAVDWALRVLSDVPWEAPRLLAYLAAFTDRAAVRTGTEQLLLRAVDSGNVWLAARLAALACSTGVSLSARRALVQGLAGTESRTLWGLLLRALALSGHGDAVTSEIRRRTLDHRAALAALRDLALPVPDALLGLVGPTAKALGDDAAPVPSLRTIL
jgi:hypothetical protein